MNLQRRYSHSPALPPSEAALSPSTSTTRDRVVPPRPALANISILHRTSRSMGSVPTTSASSSSLHLPSSNDATARARMHAGGVSDVVELDRSRSGRQQLDATSTSGLGIRATRIFAAIRRSNSFKRQGRDERGMFSTPEERSGSFQPGTATRRGRTRSPDLTMQPPSITQIAMGLHTSRTPHLGPSHSRRLSSEPPNSRTPKLSRPASSTSSRDAQPLRSSLKKTSTFGSAATSRHPSRSASPSASASISLTGSTTSGPPTPSSRFSRISTAISNSSRSRLGKFERFLGIKSQSRHALSLSNNSSDASIETPRKSVRFTPIAEQEVQERVVVIRPPKSS